MSNTPAPLPDISNLAELWHRDETGAYDVAEANLAAWRVVAATPCDADTLEISDRINAQRKAAK